jgi:hypothetical protein
MIKKNFPDKILKILLKTILEIPTITYLSKETDLSRVGIWKIIKNLKKENLIDLIPMGSGKTSSFVIRLNWNNVLLKKRLSLILHKEALENSRWLENFKELEMKVDFLIIYGSILNNPKNANDIDLLSVISEKKAFVDIDKIKERIQLTSMKKIHLINFTRKEMLFELKNNNKAFLDSIKKGIVLFGYDNFIDFMKEIK